MTFETGQKLLQKIITVKRLFPVQSEPVVLHFGWAMGWSVKRESHRVLGAFVMNISRDPPPPVSTNLKGNEK